MPVLPMMNSSRPGCAREAGEGLVGQGDVEELLILGGVLHLPDEELVPVLAAYISVLRWANRTAASRARAMVNSPSCFCSWLHGRGFLLLYPELVLLELAPGLGDLGLLGGYAGQRGVEVPLRGLELCDERVVLLLRGACAAACRQQEGGSECGEDEEQGCSAERGAGGFVEGWECRRHVLRS